MNYDINERVKRFENMMDLLIENGARVKNSDVMDIQEVSFKILDDVYILKRTLCEYDKYYELILTFPFPYKRIFTGMHLFPFDSNEFDHFNLNYSWTCANSDLDKQEAIDMERLDRELDKWEDSVKRFVRIQQDNKKKFPRVRELNKFQNNISGVNMLSAGLYHC